MVKFILIILLTLNLLADHSIPKDLTNLNLNQIQYESIKKLLKSYKHQMKKFRQKKRDSLIKKQQEFLKDDLNLEFLNEIDLNLAKEFNQIKLELLIKIHSILNKNQREKFLFYIEEWDED